MSKQVTTFIIIPPQDLAADILSQKIWLENHLKMQFPGYSFKVADSMDIGGEAEFCVLPIMNYIDESGMSKMCEKPNTELIEEINLACSRVDLEQDRKRLC